ncbi:hypothetical protein TREMEDRAFT_64930 [Tremella mesenterica DSM 1558]|nr:uncharacterized protein TREMEDRAFT_64930 [Tremella mesenterica DSM 1558]EIW67060.1 hypothetical protein TREMEDRAFT_64930 [Tremella mesenterica DSM 1558]
MSEEQDIETVSTERTSVQPATLDEAFGMALSMPETEEPQDHFRDMTEHLTYAAEKLHLKREELNRWCNCMSAPGVAFQIPGECGNIPEMTLFDLLALRTRDESVHTAFVRSIIRGSMIFKEEQAQRTAHRSQIQPTPIREMAQDTKSVTSTGSDETLIQFPEDTDSYAGPSHNT